MNTYNIRDEKVMLDSDLAEICKVEVKRLNERIKRNINSFSDEDFYQLNRDEFEDLKSQFRTLENDFATFKDDFATSSLEHGGRRKLPFVFTKKGVEIAIKIMKKDIDLNYLFDEKQETNLIPFNDDLRSKIYNVRGLQIIFDFDLAKLYQVDTKRINEQIKRNSERFPEHYRFQITQQELDAIIAVSANLRSQFATSSLEHGGRRYLPFAFTEHGIAMLASVLHSDVAIKMSIKIIDSFMSMRKIIAENANLFHRLDSIENKLTINDQKFSEVFDALEEKQKQPTQGIFHDGKVFDAYSFIAGLVRKPKKSIILIDNYIDDTVLTLLTKRDKNVSVTIYTQYISKELKLDLQKHNAQYPKINIKILKNIHDRFLILDENEIYHIGASLKDLGKKLFAFSLFDKNSFDLMNKLKLG